ncbi:H-type lectin domain-containing protein [Hasllibacter halocynthiae]|uniref:H-type lectin domain-containing protein n=1 Tax=Hasllibacter halocynthiae TaxID=595589 RepID=A0A2T0X0Y5_9RHOB|nr:H-type lectin domain-containing protein [Hasllibacter halocynthiae]PRY92608.1 H-type lectin domain-containing protein [Hasllibacter halocynthiae]
MMRIDRHRVAVAQGNVNLFSDFEEGGEMWTGDGVRSRDAAVAFALPFSGPPVVHVGLSMWDAAHDANMRVEVQAEDVTATGFRIVMHTWGDTRLARARAAWIAIGAAPNEDDWALY